MKFVKIYDPKDPLRLRIGLKCWKEIYRDKKQVVYELKKK
jgi:hypothetical protein